MNHLKDEKSPYLLQHKNNPVDWFPWSPEAFDKAQKENKIVFLSIGYSTCHWCHVMEKDSFEKEDVAQILNKDFISIKVDREERPDVDSFFMTAVQTLTGGGGWPMSVFLTPDSKPFWGGTFIPHDRFTDLLGKIRDAWKATPQEINSSSERLSDFLKGNTSLPVSVIKPNSETFLIRFAENFKNNFDAFNGGTQGSPKFPPTLSLMLLLRVAARTQDKEVLEMVSKTLKQMRRGGIYDQLGWGFHRYSTDDHWLIPHFEKMLYDNALLVSAFIEAFQLTKEAEFSQTAREIIDYILHQMTDVAGGFYSAEDADSENIEGKFYVWREEELKTILTANEFETVKNTFNITPDGNFQTHFTGDEVTAKRFTEKPALSGNVLFLLPEKSLPSESNATLQTALGKMKEKRNKRARPHLDDKILVSWNSLMISALTKAFRVFSDTKYLNAAKKAASFIKEKLITQDGILLRHFREGPSRIHGLSEDYAFFIQSLLDLFECDFDQNWFELAQLLQKKFDTLFWDPKKSGYFDNDGTDPHLPNRSKTFEDSVVPSANSIACLNLLRLSELDTNLEFKAQAEKILLAGSLLLEKYPSSAAMLLQSVDRLTDEGHEVAVVLSSKNISPNVQTFFNDVRGGFFPNLSMVVGIEGNASVKLLNARTLLNGETTFYVCRHGSCELPTNDPQAALRSIRKRSKFLL